MSIYLIDADNIHKFVRLLSLARLRYISGVDGSSALRHLTKTLTAVSWRRTEAVLRVRAALTKERHRKGRHDRRR